MIPPISVVIPLYNKERHIVRAIESVLEQTLDDFEVLVVDDGSTDNGPAKVKGFDDSRVRLIRQENAGVSEARNRGTLESKARYVAYLDADDYWAKDHLDRLHRLTLAFPDAGIYSVGHAIHERGNYRAREKVLNRPSFLNGSKFVKLYARDFSIINSSTACVRKSKLQKLGGFPKGISKGEDVYVWLRLGIANGCAFDPEICTIIDRDADNRSSSKATGEIVYYLNWLDEQIRERKLSDREISSLNVFGSKALITNMLGAMSVRDTEAVEKYKALGLAKSFRVRILIFLVELLPAQCMEHAQIAKSKFRRAYRGKH